MERTLRSNGKNKSIAIVSGLPRSGTSMMMQMLEAGGIQVVTDGQRVSDDDNPRGYYELEKVKGIKEDSSWLEEGKAYKIVSALLFFLPLDKSFSVIFMRRDLREILSSQKAMIERRGSTGAGIPDEQLMEKFVAHLASVEKWLLGRKNVRFQYFDYSDVVHDPLRQAKLVRRFLGFELDVGSMAHAVDHSLHRHHS
jgi:hypothetical protein